MKFSKMLFGLDLVLAGSWAQATSLMDKARIKAAGGVDTGAFDARHLQGRRSEVTASRLLHPEPVMTTCTLPCSWGSCENHSTKWGNYNPWCTLCSATPRAQEFTFSIDKGDKFRVRVVRDLEQCMMDPMASLHDATGLEVASDDDGTLESPLVTKRNQYKHPTGCGVHGDPYIEYTPLETQVYTLKVYNFDSDMPCPREGYKYSVYLHYHNNSIVEHGFTRDLSCSEKPEAPIAQASGVFAVPPGTFPGNQLSTTGVLEARVRYEDNKAMEPVGSVDLSSDEGPFFTSTAPKWLFTNKEQGCTRVQGSGTTADGKESLFDLIMFEKDKAVSHKIIVYDPTTDPNATKSFPHPNNVDKVLYSTLNGTEFLVDVDICISKSSLPRVRMGKKEKLCACEGNCKQNDDCLGELVCYMSPGGKSPIPGCKGRANAGYSYCVEPTTDGLCHEQRDQDFLYSRKKGGRFIFKKCSWLEGARALGRGVVRRACAQTSSSMGLGPAKDMCPVTCQTCRPQCDKYNVTGTPVPKGNEAPHLHGC